MNIKLYRWERAIDLAVKHSVHIDTVMYFRNQYLESMNKTEDNPKFREHSGLPIDWDQI